jgi:type I restriction enzyme M protein
MVKTCLCIIQRLNDNEKPENANSTFLCEVENLGYDATGRDKSGSEVDAAIAAFHREKPWQ